MRVSHVWLGYGSALFLELGELTETRRRNGSVGNPKGEITVMADCGWRLEGPRSIVSGTGESRRHMVGAASKLVGAQIVAVEIVGRLPELQIQFSNKRWLVTFAEMRGQPDWAVLFNVPKEPWLDVQGGKVGTGARTGSSRGQDAVEPA